MQVQPNPFLKSIAERLPGWPLGRWIIFQYIVARVAVDHFSNPRLTSRACAVAEPRGDVLRPRVEYRLSR